MGSDPTLDPDLEQVLVDIAADPHAKLFVTDPRKLLTGLRDGSVETPASRAGLRPAERHLLEVYRHELAFLLRQVYRVELARKNIEHVQLHQVSETELSARIRSLLCACVEPSEAAAHLLAFSQDQVDSMRVIALSLKLATIPQTVVCLGNEYLDHREFRVARRLFMNLLTTPQSQVIRYCTWEGIGSANEGLKALSRSLESYSRARELALSVSAPDALSSTSNILRLAVALNMKSTALGLSRWIDESFSQEDGILAENVRVMRAIAKSGIGVTNTSLVAFLLDSSNPSARELIHAFAC